MNIFPKQQNADKKKKLYIMFMYVCIIICMYVCILYYIMCAVFLLSIFLCVSAVLFAMCSGRYVRISLTVSVIYMIHVIVARSKYRYMYM